MPPLAIALILGLAALWGTNWVMIAFALGDFSPLALRGLVTPFAAAILLLICRATGTPLAVPREMRLPLVITALVGVTGWHLLTVYGVALLPSGSAALIAFTMPVYAALLAALFLNERFTWRVLASLALGAAGLALLVTRGLAGIDTLWAGVAVMSGAAIFWAIGTVLLKRFDWRMPTLSLATWQVVIGSTPVFLAAMVEAIPNMPMPSLEGALAAIYVGAGPVALGYWLWNKLVSLVPANIAAISVLLVPVVALASGAVVRGEPFGYAQLGALALILLALFLVLIVPGIKATPDTPEDA